jgi:hypothetical protein
MGTPGRNVAKPREGPEVVNWNSLLLLPLMYLPNFSLFPDCSSYTCLDEVVLKFQILYMWVNPYVETFFQAQFPIACRQRLLSIAMIRDGKKGREWGELE